MAMGEVVQRSGWLFLFYQVVFDNYSQNVKPSFHFSIRFLTALRFLDRRSTSTAKNVGIFLLWTFWVCLIRPEGALTCKNAKRPQCPGAVCAFQLL
jgi:hypothetical protein